MTAGGVVVDTFRERALVVATARSGVTAAPFAFARAHDGSFLASLEDADGSSLLVVIESASVHVAWVGALEAIVVRDREIVHRTAPHVFFTGASRAVAPASIANARVPGVDLAGPWPSEPGDLVLLCSMKIHHVLSAADVATLASRDDLVAIVRGLVTTTSTRGAFPALCAVAIRT